METYNIIADIAGEMNALMRLVAIMPKADKFILVGDLNDRGENSREVIKWAMETPNVITLLSNHGDMMIDFCRKTGKYEWGVWGDNGGNKTLRSYKGMIPKAHVDWLASRPLSFETEGLIITHAPIGEDWESKDFGPFWSRAEPSPIPGKLQIFGHCSQWNLRRFLDADGKLFAMCIDQSRQKILTGINCPSLEIYTVNFEE